MAAKKRRKSKKSCGCPKGSVKKRIKKVGSRCVSTGKKKKFVKSKC